MIMEEKGIFGKFLKNKMNIMNYCLNDFSDSLFLDSDIVILNEINDIDNTKEIGVSPQFIKKQNIEETGYYNAGCLWTKSKNVIDEWLKIINMDHSCPEQINMIKLRKYSYFEFGEEYNLQCWRYYLSPDGPEKIASYISSDNLSLIHI